MQVLYDVVKENNVYTDFEKAYFNGNLEETQVTTNHDIIKHETIILN